MAILFLDPFPALGILLVHVARVAIRHSGAAAIPAKELAFCAFPHFSDTSEECNEPVKNVQNGTKKRGPERDLFTAEPILQSNGLLRTAAHDNVNKPLYSHEPNVENCPYGETDQTHFYCLYRPMAIHCS